MSVGDQDRRDIGGLDAAFRENFRSGMPVRYAVEIGEILAVLFVVVAGVDEDHLALSFDQHIGVGQIADADVLRTIEHDALRNLVHRGIVEHPDRIFAHDAPRLSSPYYPVNRASNGAPLPCIAQHACLKSTASN